MIPIPMYLYYLTTIFVIGVVSLIIGFPLETIKVKQQTYHIGLVEAVRDTYKCQGIFGFYRGIVSPLFTYGPSNSLFFGIHANITRFMMDDNTVKHTISPTDFSAIRRILISGTIAGFCQTIIYCPVEYIKIILQANSSGSMSLKRYTPPYRDTYHAILGIYRTSGFSGFYRGFWPTFVRDAPSGGVYMLIYEMLRYSALKETDILNVTFKEAIAGGTAGIVSIATVIPFDVVKTHIQTDDPKQPYFKGIIDCFQKLYANDGIKIFFKGLPIICFRAFPAHAVMFVGYEFVLTIFE